MVGRRRHQVEEQQPLGPDDDPYLAYLLWREEREAAERDERGEREPDETESTTTGATGIRSLFGRLSARRHVNRSSS
ncbi:hypothetical protein [Agromyces arachidis]|uniref:hypothetical protein n=1 Tax=Agromyces arachidis TaxID=766966 RepID=UPI0040569C50